MKRYLTARQEEGSKVVDRELAALLVESVAGDEVVVEDVALHRAAHTVLGQGDCSEITITVDKVAVEAERARIRDENAAAVMRRMTGAERNSPGDLVRRTIVHGVPGATPGARTFEPPQPEHVHHPRPVPDDVIGDGPIQE